MKENEVSQTQTDKLRVNQELQETSLSSNVYYKILNRKLKEFVEMKLTHFTTYQSGKY